MTSFGTMNSLVDPASMPNASYRPDPRVGSKPATCLVLTLTLAAAPLFSQVLVDTFAGGKIRSGVPAQDVPLAPGGIAFDAAGNLVLCDQISNLIRRVRPDGTIETLVGNGTTGFSGDGGSALNAALNQPGFPRFDAQGNLYFADRSNNRIRRVDPKGVITSIAGSGVAFRAGMDLEGPALSRSLDSIGDLAVDPAGNVYFTIFQNYDGDVIRRVTASGRIEIFAGILDPLCFGCSDGDNGPALAARIVPGFLAADGKGNLFVSEYVSISGSASATHIRRIAPDGTITRFAGYGPSPTGNTVDDEAKPALDIYIFRISAMAADSTGNLYFVQAPGPTDQTGPRIRRIDTNGIVNTLAGGPGPSTSPDGPPLQTFINPQTIAADAHGNVAFTDGSAVREVTAQPTLQTLAGGAPKPAPDGTPARDAWLLNPLGIAFNPAGDLFIAETGVCLIRKIGANGLLATAAGTGKCGTSQDGVPNTTQDLAPPAGIVADNQGRLFTIDFSGNSYLITADGKVSPTGFPPTFSTGKLAIDAKGRVYLMNFFNLIRISPDGKQETIVTPPPPPGPPLGFGPTGLRDIGIDPAGNVYFTGTYYGGPTDYVFRVNDDGTFTPIYGGSANPLQFVYDAASLAVDSNGTVWLGTAFVNASGAYTLGRQDTGYSGDGGPAQLARFNASASVFAPNGDLYLLDSYAGRIRKLTGLTPVTPAVIASGGIVNAVSYTGGTISPGELISIFGSGFAASGLQVNAAENNRLPWVLGKTKVLFDGYAGAITAMTPTQINVFVPYFLQPGKSTAVTVQTDTAVSQPVLVPVAISAPGFATADQSGGGQGAILNQDSSLNGPANPAARGSVISLFGTGEGFVLPQLTWGDLSISTPFSTPVGAVAVTIGGQPAEIAYAGAAPLEPIGVLQIDVKIPATLSPGSAAVAVSIGGIATSRTVTVAIR
jgi:uncharacterized protein (TIGR03437 family)